MSMSTLNTSELHSVKSALTNPNDLGNNPELELSWAIKAMEHANIHYNLITSVDPSILKLTKTDNELYQAFREQFPDFDVGKVTEDSLKSAGAKEKWRNYCEGFKELVEDHNQGTLLRLDCKGDYTEENTIFSVRTQFLAIEIARNREGFNNGLSKKKEDKDS